MRRGWVVTCELWDREGAIAPLGRPTDAFAAFCGQLGVGRGCRISRRRWRFPQRGQPAGWRSPRWHAESTLTARRSLYRPTTNGRRRGLMRHAHPRAIAAQARARVTHGRWAPAMREAGCRRSGDRRAAPFCAARNVRRLRPRRRTSGHLLPHAPRPSRSLVQAPFVDPDRMR
jgi:hypothetical protein